MTTRTLKTVILGFAAFALLVGIFIVINGPSDPFPDEKQIAVSCVEGALMILTGLFLGAVGLVIIKEKRKIPINTRPVGEINKKLRFDGLYCEFQSNGFSLTNYCLRFYDDGTVISVTVGASREEELAGEGNIPHYPREFWFDKNKIDYFKDFGFFETSEDTISFTQVGECGSIEYSGVINDDNLVLDTHSNINGRDAKDRVYKFIPFDDIEEWKKKYGV